MNSTSSSTSTSRKVPGDDAPLNAGNWLIWALLIVVLCFTIFVRLRLVTLPLERDEGEYAYGGQLLLEHRGLLYRDIHSLKWPGTFTMYALGFLIGGKSIVEIRLQLLLLNLATAAGVFLLASELMRRREALFAATIFLALSVLPCIQGLVANAEHFVNVFAVFGWWMLLRGLRLERKSGLIAGGLLLGISLCMKQHAIFGIAAGGIIAVCSAPRQSGNFWKSALARGMLFGAGVSTAIAGMFLAVWTHGAWEDFWKWTMVYSRDYTSQVSLAEAPMMLQYQVGRILPIILPVSFLSAAGLFWIWRKESRWRALVVTSLFLAGFLGTTPGFYFREHYFLLMVPAVSLLAAIGLEAAVSFAPGHRIVPLLGAFLVLAVGWPLAKQRDLLIWKSVNQVSRALYGINPFVESPAVADYLKRHMDHRESLVIFGSEPQIAFYADRKLASGYIYMYPLMERHPLALSMQQEFIHEVMQAQPEYAVVVDVRTSWLVRPNSERLVLNWMSEFLNGYELCGRIRIQPSGYSEYEFTDEVLPPGPHEDDSILIYRRKG